MAYQDIIYEKDGRIGRLILNRPEKRNLLSWRCMDEIMDALRTAISDEQVRVIIIKGAGLCFSAGHDIGEVGLDIGLAPGAKRRPSVRVLMRREERHLSAFYDYVFNYPKPLIAQVHGYCIHGAYNLQLMCDITIAAEDTHFEGQGAPVVNIACYIPLAAWPTGLGRRNVAFHLSGKDAENLGMINRAVPIDRLEEAVEDLAQAISRMPADALELNKNSVNGLLDLASLSAARRVSNLMHAMGTLQRMRPGEYSFFKSRRDFGVKATIEARRSAELARAAG
ncbi:MAG: enoyl-CoA hydratase/isomerase family protein [Chloroflexi bacterium]|nr:enoyl-CoA hydratase/isomerase family protein [Chloroflexota bacterium]